MSPEAVMYLNNTFRTAMRKLKLEQIGRQD